MMTKIQDAVLKFRIAEGKDVETLVQLVNGAYRGPTGRLGWTTESEFLDGQRTDADLLKATLGRPGSFVILAERAGRIVGCVHVESQSAETCALGMLTVDVREQRSGIGAALMCEAERFAREKLSARTMRMSVIWVRTELLAWYEKRGYRPTGETAAFPYGDERFGIPLRSDLEFVILSKGLNDDPRL